MNYFLIIYICVLYLLYHSHYVEVSGFLSLKLYKIIFF